MLVITRKRNQAVWFQTKEGSACVRILGVRHGRVRVETNTSTVTLKREQAIWIETMEGRICVRILGVVGYDRVKVGIDAPQSVNILREELLENNAQHSKG